MSFRILNYRPDALNGHDSRLIDTALVANYDARRVASASA